MQLVFAIIYGVTLSLPLAASVADSLQEEEVTRYLHRSITGLVLTTADFNAIMPPPTCINYDEADLCWLASVRLPEGVKRLPFPVEPGRPLSRSVKDLARLYASETSEEDLRNSLPYSIFGAYFGTESTWQGLLDTYEDLARLLSDDTSITRESHPYIYAVKDSLDQFFTVMWPRKILHRPALADRPALHAPFLADHVVPTDRSSWLVRVGLRRPDRWNDVADRMCRYINWRRAQVAAGIPADHRDRYPLPAAVHVGHSPGKPLALLPAGVPTPMHGTGSDDASTHHRLAASRTDEETKEDELRHLLETTTDAEASTSSGLRYRPAATAAASASTLE